MFNKQTEFRSAVKLIGTYFSYLFFFYLMNSAINGEDFIDQIRPTGMTTCTACKKQMLMVSCAYTSTEENHENF